MLVRWVSVYGLFSTFSLSFFFKDFLNKFVQRNSFKEKSWVCYWNHADILKTLQYVSWFWYLNYLDGFHVSSYSNLCSTNFILFETVCCSKVIRRRRKKIFVTTLCSRSLIHRAHGEQWRDEPVDEQEATCELGASYVKKLFGTLFFHSAKPTSFSHQSLHHFSNCTSLSVVIVSGTWPSLFCSFGFQCKS